MKNRIILINIIGKVPPPVGGVTIHTIRLYQWLKKEKYIDVKLTALNKNSSDDKNIQYIGNYLFWIIKKLIFGFKEDIVHYQGANYHGLLVLSIIKKIHPKFNLVWTVHSEYIILKIKNRKLFRFIMQEIDRIITVNDNIKNQLKGIVRTQNNIHVISPFLMPENYNKTYNKILDKYRQDNEIILLFNAYRLEFNDKNQDIYGLNTLIDAFKYVDINAKLILLIPSINNKERVYYNSLLEKLNIGCRKRIVLISDINTDGWKYINSADIFIRPTITDGDALSVKESIYMDKITVVSDCTIRPDNVILFKTSCSKDLARKINFSLSSEKKTISFKKDGDNLIFYTKLYQKIMDRSVIL
jgi:hypothetical protein